MIHMRDVCKEYENGSVALKNINVDIDPGEFVFIVGPSGAGKSTFIRLLLREVLPSSGELYVSGQDVVNMTMNKVPFFRRKLGVIFQDFRLLSEKTVAENVAFAMQVIEAPRRTMQHSVNSVLDIVGLRPKYRSFPSQLSGGEQQRVAIARALINKPKILLADEPTGNLDSNNAWEIMHLMEEINSRGTTVVVVTHNIEIVRAMNKRVITMRKGVVVDDSDSYNSAIEIDSGASADDGGDYDYED